MRLEHVHRLAQLLRAAPAPGTSRRLAQLLEGAAGDDRYEVRHAVALAVADLHDGAFDRIVALLADDPSPRVKGAAETALQGRRHGVRTDHVDDEQSRARRELEQLAARHPRLVARITELVRASFHEAAENAQHDVNLVLTALEHFGRVLRRGLVEAEVAQALWQGPLDEVLAGHALVRTILKDVVEFAGAAPTRFERVNVLAMVRQAIALERTRAGGAVAIQEQIDPLLELDATRHHLLRVLQNALSNAFEAGARTVTVSAESAAGRAVIRVIDDGCGVLTEDRGRVFTWGFSTKKSQSPSRAHSGRGLKIARKLVEDLRGELWFESEEGEGATVTLSLPLEQDPLPEEGP